VAEVEWKSDGICSIRYTQGGDSETEPAIAKIISFGISLDKAKISQRVVFSETIPNLEVGSVVDVSMPTATSGHAVEVTSLTASHCSVEKLSDHVMRLRILASGTCSINGLSRETDLYREASHQLTLNVDPGVSASNAFEGARRGLAKYCPAILNYPERPLWQFSENWSTYSSSSGREYLRYQSWRGAMLLSYSIQGSYWVYSPGNGVASIAWADWGCTSTFKVKRA
jgi:hypothetical protein